MQLSSHKKVQHWKNENRFLQVQERHKNLSMQETILVGLRCHEDDLELLAWAINVAAASGDTIIAFQLNRSGSKLENMTGKLQAEDYEAWSSHQKALKELCEVKQIHLEFDFALSGNEELELVHEAAAVLATMLVISPPSNQVLWNPQRKGNSLAQKAPLGCSIIIVKSYNVLFFKESRIKESKASDSTICEDPHLCVPYRRIADLRSPPGSHQRQFSRTSSPLWSRHIDDETSDDHNNKVVNKAWTTHMGGGSPRGVFDLFESASSSPSTSSYGNLSSSVSLKGFLSCIPLQQDVDQEKTHHCLGLWRNGSSCRTLAISPSRCFKRIPGPLDYTSVRNSFKSYVNTLWGIESMRHDPPISAYGKQKWRSFLYEEIAFATTDFNPANLVGKGGHAEVYKGTLLDGRTVAIKRLREGRSEEIKECDFLTELGIIGHEDHPNTTPLVGFCVEEGLHLIFDFSPNGSLATWLHGVNTPLLDWSVRYKIAVGIARGLHYLHTVCPRRIIHRDIKASNILLGPELEPQISDFGLAKWLPEHWSQLSISSIEGTFGHLAPEYFRHGIVHGKTDVFAFGVLLLELITGRMPIDDAQQSLVMWAKPLLESSRIEELADPRLEGAYDLQEMQTLIMAAGLCVQSSAICRPFMGQVLESLISSHSVSFSTSLSQSDLHYDSSEEYYSTIYRSDLNRHREIALQF
ncbi:hypothetical protein GOP47_0026359 [Adiantum capillus-veneris]|nr:hypothetical protein GOP47_0026359 [Adiantum capillus-veneris]